MTGTSIPRRFDRYATRWPPTPRACGWGTRLFVLDDPPTLVGWGGFKGSPRDGIVELGYAVAPSWRGRGLATEAVRELVHEAFAAAEVQTVLAHTLAEVGRSVRVLEKVGFSRERMVADHEVGRTWRFRLERASNGSAGPTGWRAKGAADGIRTHDLLHGQP